MVMPAAIDQGTTSTRFMIFDHEGEVVGIDQKEHEQIFPKPGWVEHNPQRSGSAPGGDQGARSKARISADDIAAVGITNQRETTSSGRRPPANRLQRDRLAGHPHRQDLQPSSARTAARTASARSRPAARDLLLRPKGPWILDNVDGCAERPSAASTVRQHRHLADLEPDRRPHGGVHVTDVTNASRTMLMNLETLDWDEEILDAHGHPAPCCPRSAVLGVSTGRRRLAMSAGIPSRATWATSRPPCSARPASTGEAKNTYGTGCFLLLNTGTETVPSKSGLLTTLCYKIGDAQAVYAWKARSRSPGARAVAARQPGHDHQVAPRSRRWPARSRTTAACYFVPAFSGLFAPYWRSDARGVIVGLTRYVNKGHIARATWRPRPGRPRRSSTR